MGGCSGNWGPLIPTRQHIKNYISSKRDWGTSWELLLKRIITLLLCGICGQHILIYKQTLLFYLSFRETWPLLMIFWSQLKMPHHLLQETFLHPHQESIFLCASKAAPAEHLTAHLLLPVSSFVSPTGPRSPEGKNTSFLVNHSALSCFWVFTPNYPSGLLLKPCLLCEASSTPFHPRRDSYSPCGLLDLLKPHIC